MEALETPTFSTEEWGLGKDISETPLTYIGSIDFEDGKVKVMGAGGRMLHFTGTEAKKKRLVAMSSRVFHGVLYLSVKDVRVWLLAGRLAINCAIRPLSVRELYLRSTLISTIQYNTHSV